MSRYFCLKSKNSFLIVPKSEKNVLFSNKLVFIGTARFICVSGGVAM